MNGKNSLDETQIGCCKCGKTVWTTWVGSEKRLPEGWISISLATNEDPTPGTMAVCNECKAKKKV